MGAGDGTRRMRWLWRQAEGPDRGWRARV